MITYDVEHGADGALVRVRVRTDWGTVMVDATEHVAVYAHRAGGLIIGVNAQYGEGIDVRPAMLLADLPSQKAAGR
jgi:hypothetical protein